jgi:sugar phosphate isomerase/epimerase
MRSPPFGVSQYSTWPQNFAQDLQLYQENEIEFVEVCEAKLDASNPHLQLRLLQETNLKVSSIQPRLHSLFPDNPRPVPKSPADRMAHLSETIKLFGKYFPGATIVTISGAAPDGDYSLAYQTATHEYKKIAAIAADHGMRVALEPLNPILMNIDTFICSLAHASRIIEAVGHPAFGLFLDVWHIWEDPAAQERIKAFGEKIFGVHVNDWLTPRAFGDRYLPGDGEIELVPLLRAIVAAGYTGAYTLEVFSEIFLPGSLWTNPEKTVRQGKESFARVWEQAHSPPGA